MIVVDELVSNAIRHAGRNAMLSVCVTAEVVRVGVTDQLGLDRAVFKRSLTAASGLSLVWQLSREPYTTELDEGKSSAAEIARREADPDTDGRTRPVAELH